MMKNELRSLINHDAFELYGQPKWTFGKNTCNTYEVFAEKVSLPTGERLSAWPILRMIENDEDLTLDFSHRYLEAAMRSAIALTLQTNANVTLSINLLPLYANHETFEQDIDELLRVTRFNPLKLQFELSEAQKLTSRGIDNLNALHDQQGVKLLLANFGTGHSNVDLLCDVHFDGLELDRSLTARIPDNEQACRVVVGIMHMADTLDLLVCAKGIENQEQFEFFEELDCYKGQGFLIGKPMPLGELRDYIAKYALPKGHV